jgi:phosphatidylinositol-3-phosphatase
MRLWLSLFVWVGVALGQVPQSKHVWLITEENHSYESVIGNSSMPYFNSLAKKYGLATQYYSPLHNSLSALMWLVAGQTVTADNSTTACFTDNNVVRQVLAKGMRWRSYQVDLPYAGFQGLYNLNYVRRHNPLIDFSDSCTAEQRVHSVPYTQLATDIADHATPNYVYITPNVDEDSHDGTLGEADQWLSQNLPAILKLPEFKPGGDGLLFVVFDEGDLFTDNRCSSRVNLRCGGRIATLVIGPQVKPGYRSSVLYSHANLLRTVCDAMSFTSCPGAGALAAPMSDFFNKVKISTPPGQAQVASPVRVAATTSNSSPVYEIQVYIDDQLKYPTSGSKVDASLPIDLGKHHIVVQSWDTAGGIHKSGVDVNVQSEAVIVTSPVTKSVVSSPVPIQATAGGQSPIRNMLVYADGSLRYQNSGGSVNTSLSLTPGPHSMIVEARDDSGGSASKNLSVAVATPSVSIKIPAANASVYSPVQVFATTVDPKPIYAMQVYLDNALHYEFRGNGINAALPMPLGQHYMMVQAWDATGGIYKKGIQLNVLPIVVTVSSPAPNSTVASPVHVHASVPGASTAFTIQVYVDDGLQYQQNGKTLDAYLKMGTGKHHIVAKAWDSGGGTWTTGVYVTVK